MRSMTGFGKGYAVNPSLGIAFTVEISSVNRKQLEIRASMPHEITSLEPLLRNVIKEKVSRGTVMARVLMTLEDNHNSSSVKINHSLLKKLASECSELQKELGDGTWSIAELMTMPGIIETVPPDLEKTEIKALFTQAVEAAVTKLVAMREAEGQVLCDDLKNRCQELVELTDKLAPLVEKVPDELRKKLFDKLENADLPVDINDERMLKELVFYVDRADVSEELTRLRSHFSQFEKFLDKKGKTVGRSMDFLLQEMFREITTFGNKAASCEVTPLIVEFKTGLEKIREQVQNIE